MKYPNFNEEKKLWKQGFKCVVGLDEAGRGPLAGPVVAGAVAVKNPNDQISMTNQILNSKFQKRFGHWTLGLGISEVRDSKKMAGKQQEKVYKKLTKCKDIEWGIGIVSEKVIDIINILEATKLAMKKALNSLRIKIDDRQIRCCTNFLLIDGNFKLDNVRIPQKPIIKADEKVFSCAAASIIAKVTRDRLMKKYHKKYPQYGFDRHKGYPTKAHFANLQKFGPCKIHRKSFWPVRACEIPNPNAQ